VLILAKKVDEGKRFQVCINNKERIKKKKDEKID